MIEATQLKAIAPALVAMQKQIRGALKDSKNPHFKSTFANLESVWDACREALAANDLCVIQSTDVLPNGEPVLRTVLMHSSGEYISGMYPLRPVKADPQGYLAALTYARRGCLASMLGIVQVDDDGETASGRGEAAQPVQVVRSTVSLSPERAALNQSLTDTFGAHAEAFTALCVKGGLIKKGAHFTTLSTPDAKRALDKHVEILAALGVKS